MLKDIDLDIFYKGWVFFRRITKKGWLFFMIITITIPLLMIFNQIEINIPENSEFKLEPNASYISIKSSGNKSIIWQKA